MIRCCRGIITSWISNDFRWMHTKIVHLWLDWSRRLRIRHRSSKRVQLYFSAQRNLWKIYKLRANKNKGFAVKWWIEGSTSQNDSHRSYGIFSSHHVKMHKDSDYSLAVRDNQANRWISRMGRGTVTDSHSHRTNRARTDERSGRGNGNDWRRRGVVRVRKPLR